MPAVTASELPNIRGLSLLEGLAESRKDELLRSASVERYPRGAILAEQGKMADVLHIILSGTVELYSSAQGRELGVFLMNSGDVLMPAAALYSEPYLVSARSVATARVLLLDAVAVRRVAAASAELALRLARIMAGQFRVSVRQIVDLKCRNAAQRLGSFLLRLADDAGSSPAELTLPKRHLAGRIGMTPETLSRSLQILADHGLVVRGRQVILRDRPEIERFCGAEPCSGVRETILAVNAR